MLFAALLCGAEGVFSIMHVPVTLGKAAFFECVVSFGAYKVSYESPTYF